MKNYKIAVIAMMAMIYQIGYGQVTDDVNTPIGGNYVGFDNTSLIDLPIENGGERMRLSFENWTGINGLTNGDANRIAVPIDPSVTIAPIFSMMHLGDNTNALLRRPWMNVGTSYIESGDIMYVGLLERPDPSGSTVATDAVVTWGCNDDFFVPGSGPDNLRFLFIAPTNSQSPGNTQQGLETMRITPNGDIGMGSVFNNAQQPQNRLEIHNNDGNPQLRISETYNSVFSEMETSPAGDLHILPQGGSGPNAVAIGFLPGQLGQDPQTQGSFATVLDVGGLTRIRNLPNVGSNNCLVIGSTATGGAGQQDAYLKRLNFTGNSDDILAGDGTWIDISSTGTSDLDWESDGTDVWTGHGLNGYPGGDVFVGSAPFTTNARFVISDEAIGNSRAGGRIEINNNGSGSGTTRGLDVFVADNTDGGFNAGVDALVRGGKFAVGGRFNANVFNNQSEWSAGVAGYCSGTINSPAVDVIGVYGYAENSVAQTTTRPIGVYGEAIFTGSTPTIQIAGHFQGLMQQLQPPIILSDASLKQNIETIENANDILSELNPVSYNYDMVEAFGIDAGESISHGFLAQELQSSFPAAVEDFYVPERRDTAGVVTRERSMHLGVKYNEFIALLVKGHQEQNDLFTAQAAMITEQEVENEELLEEVNDLKTQMAEIQEQMATLLSAYQRNESKMNNCCGTTPTEKGSSETGGIELEQNFPNPFDEVTTINFSINEPAQIRLEISDAQGRVLEVLVNARQDAGEYTERWDASAYAPGIYYYSLYADTELLTKKMIKR